MANIRNNNTYYVDSTGTLATNVKNAKIVYILFTTAAAGDELTLRDTDGSGALKLTIKHQTADNTHLFDFSANPLVFPNAIHVDTITAGAVATLVLKSGEA